MKTDIHTTLKQKKIQLLPLNEEETEQFIWSGKDTELAQSVTLPLVIGYLYLSNFLR